ncbi:rhamnogalacturonan acetylesterase [Saccharicrinis sp. FJH54]|uniref:rhamnogalacturonan acetylesterase n=1 Tax=Saccharicrinis sp. FJH54 TaxID=3344665 RepID=UPI0035D4D6D1
MKRDGVNILSLFVLITLFACKTNKHSVITVWLIGDSTVADYTQYGNYETERFPVTGWGQVFQQFMNGAYRDSLANLLQADSVMVDDRARGGRSTRTFFQEGRWRAVYESLKPGDWVLIQFGHNDAAENKPERYVDPEGYKEFLRLFVSQSLQNGAMPVLLTPVARNYPWKDGVLTNVHGVYPDAVKEVAEELSVPLIDLNRLSMDFFTSKGETYSTTHYFMNLPAGKYVAYPDGQHDNTHFQPEGAQEVAKLVYHGLQKIANQRN